MTPNPMRYAGVLFAIILLCTAGVASAFAQDLEFADGLVYNDFFAVTVSLGDEESFTIFDAAAFEGENPPWPDREGNFGTVPGSSPGNLMSYFLWVRRGGATGEITYPLSFRKIKTIQFIGPYGGTASTRPIAGTLVIDDTESTVSLRRDDTRFSGWFGPMEPSVPYYTPAVLTLTDDSIQRVWVKTDGFLGGIDEDFGTYAMIWLRHDGVKKLTFRNDGAYARCPECGAIFFDDRSDVCPFDGASLIPSRKQQ